jgi:hypothetical protein
MTSVKRMSAVVSLTVLALAAALAPAAAQGDTHRAHHGRWHYARPYQPGQDRIDEGPSFYEGYRYNSNNACYSGESMYDGC